MLEYVNILKMGKFWSSSFLIYNLSLSLPLSKQKFKFCWEENHLSSFRQNWSYNEGGFGAARNITYKWAALCLLIK